MKPSRARQLGFSLLEVLVTSSLLALVATGAMSLSKVMGKQQTQANATFQLSQVARQFSVTLQSTIAWNKTLLDPANAISFRCLLNHSTSCYGAGGPVKMDDVSGASLNGWVPIVPPFPLGGPPYYQFTQSGTPCTTFIPPTPPPPPGTIVRLRLGHDSCPFGLRLTWNAICPGSPPTVCDNTNVQVQVTGTWSQNFRTPQRQLAFNGKNYDFQGFAGTPTAGLCPPGQVAVGMTQTTGVVVCQPLSTSTTCPPGQVMVGLTNGAAICKTLYSYTTPVCPATYEGQYNDYGCTATCSTGTWVTGGGFYWGAIFMNTAGGSYSYTKNNGYHCGINIGTCSGGLSHSCGSGCFAICSGWQ